MVGQYSAWAGKKVLIIDNDPDSLTILQQLLELYDIKVTCAYSGKEGIAALEQQQFYCVLTDIVMPGVSGWELIAFVRQHSDPAICNTFMIAVTAHAMSGDREHVLEAGFDGYIEKPIEPAVFLNAVQQIIDRRTLPPA
ncbi:MAG: response regulator [Chloroflexota bacterium]